MGDILMVLVIDYYFTIIPQAAWIFHAKLGEVDFYEQYTIAFLIDVSFTGGLRPMFAWILPISVPNFVAVDPLPLTKYWYAYDDI